MITDNTPMSTLTKKNNQYKKKVLPKKRISVVASCLKKKSRNSSFKKPTQNTSILKVINKSTPISKRSAVLHDLWSETVMTRQKHSFLLSNEEELKNSSQITNSSRKQTRMPIRLKSNRVKTSRNQ